MLGTNDVFNSVSFVSVIFEIRTWTSFQICQNAKTRKMEFQNLFVWQYCTDCALCAKLIKTIQRFVWIKIRKLGFVGAKALIIIKTTQLFFVIQFHDCENSVLQLGIDNTRTMQNWSYLRLKVQQSFWFLSPTFFNILLGYVLIHFLHDLWSEVIHDEVQIEEICFPLKLPTLHFDRRVL